MTTTELLAARVAAIHSDPGFAASVGLTLARHLGLPMIACGPDKGRYRTQAGPITPAALARTLLRVVEGEA